MIQNEERDVIVYKHKDGFLTWEDIPDGLGRQRIETERDSFGMMPLTVLPLSRALDYIDKATNGRWQNI